MEDGASRSPIPHVKAHIPPTEYADAVDAFRSSDAFRKLTNPATLGTTTDIQRTYMAHRLLEGFELGWNARDYIAKYSTPAASTPTKKVAGTV